MFFLPALAMIYPITREMTSSSMCCANARCTGSSCEDLDSELNPPAQETRVETDDSAFWLHQQLCSPKQKQRGLQREQSCSANYVSTITPATKQVFDDRTAWTHTNYLPDQCLQKGREHSSPTPLCRITQTSCHQSSNTDLTVLETNDHGQLWRTI